MKYQSCHAPNLPSARSSHNARKKIIFALLCHAGVTGFNRLHVPPMSRPSVDNVFEMQLLTYVFGPGGSAHGLGQGFLRMAIKHLTKSLSCDWTNGPLSPSSRGSISCSLVLSWIVEPQLAKTRVSGCCVCRRLISHDEDKLTALRFWLLAGRTLRPLLA